MSATKGLGTAAAPRQLKTPPPVLEALGNAEVEHLPRGNRMRAVTGRT
jgi:hypothetical protein